MVAIDTNIIVRFLTDDDLEQSTRARHLIETQETFVATTVLLETAWVLKSVYKLDAHDIASALDGFARLPKVSLEDPRRVPAALAHVRAGLDIADAIHLEGRPHGAAFLTFDERLVKAARRAGLSDVRSP